MTVLLCILLLSSGSQQRASASAIAAGAEALAENKAPWYDPQHDDLRLLVPPEAKDLDLQRRAVWQASAKATSSTGTAVGGGRPWSLLEIAAWGILAVLLAALTSALAWAFFRSESRKRAHHGPPEGSEEVLGAARLQQLPFPLAATKVSLLERARQLAAAGQLEQAVVYLYSHVLFWLDAHHRIHLARGKTNRQYYAELLAVPEMQQEFAVIMQTFEDVFFGDRRVAAAQLDRCWRGLDVLERHVEQPAS